MNAQLDASCELRPMAEADLEQVIDMTAIREAGLSIPEDVSIIGYDGVEIGEIVTPALTTVSQNIDRLAEIAVVEIIRSVNSLSSSLNGIVEGVSLTVRESTGPPKQSSKR